MQTGEIRSRGIELEGVASFDSGLDVTVAYTFLDAEITKSNAESDSGESELGNRPERTPKHSASLWADYTIPEATSPASAPAPACATSARPSATISRT